jgi:hypothetical protein
MVAAQDVAHLQGEGESVMMRWGAGLGTGFALILVGLIAVPGIAVGEGPEEPLERLVRFAPIAGESGAAAWSRHDPSTSRYQLVIWRAGTAQIARIPTRRAPFDVDLGLDARNRLVATYSRCRSYAVIRPFSELDIQRPGQRCRLYLHRVGTGSERRIRAIGKRGFSDFAPSVWRSRIAFARLGRDGRITLHVRGLDGGRVQDLVSRSSRPEALPTRLDMRGSRIAYGWRYERSGCPRDLSGGWDKTFVASEVWTSDLRRAGSRLVASACDSGPVISVTSPTMRGSLVTYLKHERPAPGSSDAGYSIETADGRGRSRSSQRLDASRTIHQHASAGGSSIVISDHVVDGTLQYLVSRLP